VDTTKSSKLASTQPYAGDTRGEVARWLVRGWCGELRRRGRVAQESNDLCELGDAAE
jgi:hypothetical protein